MENEKNSLSDFIQNFDYFGVKFGFKIKNKESFKTHFGAVTFIIFLIISLIYFLFTFPEFVKRKNFTINYIYGPPKAINFQKQGFNFAYSLNYDSNNSFIDHKIVSFIKATCFLTTIRNSNINDKIRIALIPKNCEEKDLFDKIDTKDFNSLQLNKFTCFQINESIQIEGSSSDPIYQYIELGISINDMIFNSGNFSSIQEFLAINPVKMILNWIDTTIDVNNYTNPISNFIESNVVYLDFSIVKKINMDYSTIQFSTDNNYLIKNQITSNNITYSKDQSYELFVNDRIISNESLFVKFFLRSSQSCDIIERNYQKLNTFLANFGGIVSNLLLILFIFVKFLNEFWANQEVLNNIIKFSDHLKINYPEHLNLLQSNLNRFESNLVNKVSDENYTPNNNNINNNIIDKSIAKNSNESENIPPKKHFDLIQERKDILLKNLKLKNELIEIPLSKDDLCKNIEENSIDFQGIRMDQKHIIPKFMASKNLLVSNDIPIEILNKIEKFEKVEKKERNKIIQDHHQIEKFEKVGKKEMNKIIQDHHQIEKFKKIDNSKLFSRRKAVVFDKELEIIFGNSKKALNFSCYEILLRYFSCKSNGLRFKNILYEKAKNKLENYFDVVTFITKMQEIEMLKYLLLNEKQIKMFNFLSKPSISKEINSNEINMKFIQKKKSDMVDIEEFQEIIKFYNDNNLIIDNDLNKKLFKLFDNEVENLL